MIITDYPHMGYDILFESVAELKAAVASEHKIEVRGDCIASLYSVSYKLNIDSKIEVLANISTPTPPMSHFESAITLLLKNVETLIKK